MKKVSLTLYKKIYDPQTEGGKAELNMTGVVLSGTPAQVALIYECLGQFGPIDVIDQENLKILEQCETSLNKARENGNKFQLDDPDDPVYPGRKLRDISP